MMMMMMMVTLIIMMMMMIDDIDIGDAVYNNDDDNIETGIGGTMPGTGARVDDKQSTLSR